MAIRVDGQALRSAIRYAGAKLRGSACGQICTAGLPEGARETTDSPQARAVLAVGRSCLGWPWSRLEASQARLGVPVPEATQWEQIEAVGDGASKVLAPREHEAAQGALILHDDTAGRLLALRQENRALVAAAQAHGLSTPQDRTGMHTTALVVKVGEHTAILYDSSRRHAGENLQGLLDQRAAGLAKPLALSDALASHALTNEAAVLRCHCLAHGRRKCSDLAEVFPHACQVVLEVMSQVFDHDEQARKEPRSPEERLGDHQARSQPLMDGLKRWRDTPCDEHLVEPTSTLGKAMGYRQRHGVPLTRFLSVPGAPLDHHLAERAVQLCIRQRTHARFFQSEHSAAIARGRTSLMATGL